MSKLRTRIVQTLAAIGLLATGAACNEVSFLVQAPNVRGITIPVPPPSFTGEPLQRVDIDGNLDLATPQTGTRVEIFEQVSGRGYYTFSVEGLWVVPEVLVDVTDNCLVVSSTDDEGQISVRQNFKIFVAEADACDASCSEPDDTGACLCFENWNSGC